MKRNSLTRDFALVSALLLSLACSLVNAPPPPATEPTTSVYATAITTGGTHACALLNNGKVKCWGANDSGQLGDGTYISQDHPVEVPGLSDVVAVSAGGEYTCALLSTGEVMCWGRNNSGQLGDGTNDLRDRPTLVTDLTDVISVSAGTEHTCAVTKDGGAYCWGKNAFGRVGNGSNTRLILSPVEVSSLTSNVKNISAGNEHTCAVTNEGTVKCWGKNDNGQLGDDTTKNQTVPAAGVNLGEEAKAVGTGFSTSCALTTSGSVKCWGWIGRQDYYTSSQNLDGLKQDNIAIAVGADHICGLTANGTVRCLGENEHGQLGNGRTTPAYSAASVVELDQVKSIAANFYFTCALTSSGEVFCWGSNSSGQLGNGSNADSAKPVQVSGLTE